MTVSMRARPAFKRNNRKGFFNLKGDTTPQEDLQVAEWLEADPVANQKELDIVRFVFEGMELYGNDADVYKRQVEFLTSPAIDGYSMPWYKQLVAHEYRHAVQYNNCLLYTSDVYKRQDPGGSPVAPRQTPPA